MTKCIHKYQPRPDDYHVAIFERNQIYGGAERLCKLLQWIGKWICSFVLFFFVFVSFSRDATMTNDAISQCNDAHYRCTSHKSCVRTRDRIILTSKWLEEQLTDCIRLANIMDSMRLALVSYDWISSQFSSKTVPHWQYAYTYECRWRQSVQPYKWMSSVFLSLVNVMVKKSTWSTFIFCVLFASFASLDITFETVSSICAITWRHLHHNKPLARSIWIIFFSFFSSFRLFSSSAATSFTKLNSNKYAKVVVAYHPLCIKRVECQSVAN